MKNIVLSLVVIALVAFGGYKFFNSRKDVDAGVPVPQVATSTIDTSAKKDMYIVDLSTSTITWKGSFVSGAKSESGTIMLKSGEGKFENGMITSGVFVIDMASIKDAKGSAQLETHLKSDDFFNVVTYPEAKFELVSLTKATAKDTFTAKGNLTIRDVTKEISFPIVVVANPDTRTLKASGKISFNRADFNVKYGSSSFFKGLGDKVIKDQIDLTLNLITEPIEVSAPPSSIQ